MSTTVFSVVVLSLIILASAGDQQLYGAPVYNAPVYGAPAPVYNAPQAYGAPVYGAQGFGGAQSRKYCPRQGYDQYAGRYTSHAEFARTVGLLELFEGTWEGRGFTMISLPNYDNKWPSTGPSNYRVKVDSTWETLTFKRLGSPVPNRGSIRGRDNYYNGQKDINLGGLSYEQYIVDKETGDELHFEPGFFLRVPNTQYPYQNETYVRLATIPHGDSVLAQSVFHLWAPGGPLIDPLSTLPIGTDVTGAFLQPFYDACLPAGFSFDDLVNPNRVLLRDISRQKILSTIVIVFDTKPVGGILNIPHVIENANAESMQSVFWIEIVEDRYEGRFLQLQYTQTVNMTYLGVKFPHVSVATLRKKIDAEY